MKVILISELTYLQDTVFSTLLLGQHFQSVLIISRSDNTIRDFPRNYLCSGKITGGGQGDKITERRHPVSTPGASIGTSQRGQRFFQVFDAVDNLLCIVEFDTDGSTGRRNMFE